MYAIRSYYVYELALPLVQGMDTLPEAFAAQRGKLESGELNIAAGESTILYIVITSYSIHYTKLYDRQSGLT